ncbi:uncharacterized protein N7498_002083 [Penicillium cinerascens]|uniref:PH domain-containing protein n=1 Tax=Penicillium cinerascens TaxID=70096 RepID=A0A9W9TAT2_9EURO|nr:uncharacterized protein N7498_002083 [Penicillium cinerascens]KAJ5215676.1 hypothetical protein N7498_002083 [Penicillium cinerascens]
MSSMTPDSMPPSFGERRGHRLAPLQTNFSPAAATETKAQASRLSRPRPHDYPSTNGSGEPVPLQSPVKRQSSKSSLRSLFGRDKSTRAAAALDSKLAEIDEAQQPVTQIVTVSDASLSPDLLSPRTVASTPTVTSPTTPRPRATLKTTRTPPPPPPPPPPQPVIDPKQRSQEQYGWKPPPLFQAYPQSFKHECLSAPAISADSILRLHATMGRSDADNGRKGSHGHIEASDAARKKKEQKERKHTRTVSSSINKVDWTKKIYVLSTTGYILQYAGEGKNDRLPEKMLPLGPKSVAFASDAIPGKHWVLQISQNPTADAGPESAEPPKSRLRFGFHRSNARRLARSFLLVFDNPESMISWLTVVRAEIEARGGPKLTAEKHSEDDMPEPQLRSKSSVRQMVRKDPHRVSSLFLQPVNLQSSNEEEDGQSVGGMTYQSRRSSYVSMNQHSAIDSRAGSMSTTTSDAQASSFISANPPVSPTEAPRTHDIESTYPVSLPTSSHDKRQSIYTSSKPRAIPIPNRTEHVQPSSPPSTFPDGLVRSASPPAPNFSVPSFSKKFAARPGPTPISNSQPSSVAGVLRGESAEFPMSTVSSPPQSPTYSIASSRRTDSSDPPMVAYDAKGRRTLRAFNSEDALSRVVRSGQPAPNFSRVPRAAAPSEMASSPPSRPLSFVGRSGLGIQMNPEPQVQTISPPLPPSGAGTTPTFASFTDRGPTSSEHVSPKEHAGSRPVNGSSSRTTTKLSAPQDPPFHCCAGAPSTAIQCRGRIRSILRLTAGP